jgi:hypothetical protein
LKRLGKFDDNDASVALSIGKLPLPGKLPQLANIERAAATFGKRLNIFAVCYCPVPERFTICWLVTAESVNVSVPVAGPVTVGENVTPTVQVAPAPMLAPHVLLTAVNPVLAPTDENVRALLR